ncbi:MAG: ATP-NAD kinase family protein [Bacillota bacterium]|jgi:predicted polyphosphate/ATP-dependent NAD kinase
MKKLGLIVNPIAGMGGRVGLKGSDGQQILEQAKALGAKPEAPQRTIEALKIITTANSDIHLFTYPGEMGEDEAKAVGLNPFVLGKIKSGHTSAQDTISAAHAMLDKNVDLLVFAGGDGTARNICEAIAQKIPVIGIPAGVKIHSAVYAINPKSAGKAAAYYLSGKAINIKEAEVMDIDEEAFRHGQVKARLYGYMRVPELKAFMQNVKSGGYSEKEALQGIASEIVENMQPDTFYIIGPGTTTRSVMELLDLENTLLGIDVVRNKKLVARDVTENQLYELIKNQKAKIVVTAIGGQGHILGRGNQQLSPRIIRCIGRQNIIVIATQSKLISLLPQPLLVDTGDEKLDQELSGYIRVTTGYEQYSFYKLSS